MTMTLSSVRWVFQFGAARQALLVIILLALGGAKAGGRELQLSQNQQQCSLAKSRLSESFLQTSQKATHSRMEAASRLGNGSSCSLDEECCTFKDDDKCLHYCSYNGSINKSENVWLLEGSCSSRWPGFCRDDDECNMSSFCDRDITTMNPGTCKEDTACDLISCAHGQCRDGQCTCDWGYAGSLCERPDGAFAFLFYGNSSSYLVQALVAVQSIRSTSPDHVVYAVIPDKYRSITPTHFENIMLKAGIRLFYPTHIDMPPVMAADPIIKQRWDGVMDKFTVWSLTNHSQVALVDTDIVFDPAGPPAWKIFEECQAELCAVQDGDPRFMNAGVMVISPSTKRLNHLLSVLKAGRHLYDMPEQSFLTRYVEDASNHMTFMYLNTKWNSCGHGAMMANVGTAYTGMTVLHACSWGAKYADHRIITNNHEQQMHSLLVWQSALADFDSCTTHTLKEHCGQAVGCNWCDTYCMQNSIYCDSSLFTLPPPNPQVGLFTPDPARCASPPSATTKKVPYGYWSWPTVGIYQLMIDRFASPHPDVHCTDLTDYCGGTLAAAEEKINYLHDLGVDGIVLSPTAESMPRGYHGYWTKDLTKVNPKFGTEADLKHLTFRAHFSGMKVVADLNLNHAGTSQLKGFRNYSVLKPFNESRYFHDPSCGLWGSADFEDKDIETCNLYGMADYKHEDDRVWAGLMDYVREHVDTFGFDGIRVDAARHIPMEFLSQLPEKGAPVPAYYEVPYGEVDKVARYNMQDTSALYNYPLYYALRDAFLPSDGRKPMSSLVDFLKQPYPHVALNFVDNNDLPRFTKLLGPEDSMTRALYHNSLSYLMMAPGVPILLYGSEQNQRGSGSSENTTDDIPDMWRPALWEAGYNTSSSTFQLIQKLLQLRKLYKGFHSSNLVEVLASDDDVLAFLRGDVLVAVTSSVSPQSRALWSNYTLGCEFKTMCNILSSTKECKDFSPGLPTQLDFTAGEPKVLVPEEVYAELLGETREPSYLRTNEQFLQADLRRGDWSKIPNPPSIDVETLPRFHREQRESGVFMEDIPDFQVSVNSSALPSHDDDWFPPLESSPLQLLHVTVNNACVAPKIPDFIFVDRPGVGRIRLCDSEWSCNASNWDHAALNKTLVHSERPLLSLFADLKYYGYYHCLVDGLQLVPKYLKDIRAGRFDVFVRKDTPSTVMALLQRLGIPKERIFQGDEVLCSRELYFTHLASGAMIGHGLHEVRQELQLPHMEDDASNGPIVFLSRGNDSRTVSNEQEVVHALKSLGRNVTVFYANADNLNETIKVIGGAAMLVGPHGANLANMIFARPHAKVLEILPVLPYNMVNYHFRTLASALGFSYAQVGQVVSDAEINKSAVSIEPDKAVAFFWADPDKVRDTAASLLEADDSKS